MHPAVDRRPPRSDHLVRVMPPVVTQEPRTVEVEEPETLVPSPSLLACRQNLEPAVSRPLPLHDDLLLRSIRDCRGVHSLGWGTGTWECRCRRAQYENVKSGPLQAQNGPETEAPGAARHRRSGDRTRGPVPPPSAFPPAALLFLVRRPNPLVRTRALPILYTAQAGQRCRKTLEKKVQPVGAGTNGGALRASRRRPPAAPLSSTRRTVSFRTEGGAASCRGAGMGPEQRSEVSAMDARRSHGTCRGGYYLGVEQLTTSREWTR